MISWRDYRNATERVAASCIEAVKSHVRRESVVTRKYADCVWQLVLRLARQASRQGLAPDDIDRANATAKALQTCRDQADVLLARGDGLLALEAIASAIITSPMMMVIDGIPDEMDMAVRGTLPDSWRHTVDTARRILDRAVASKHFDL